MALGQFYDHLQSRIHRVILFVIKKNEYLKLRKKISKIEEKFLTLILLESQA